MFSEMINSINGRKIWMMRTPHIFEKSMLHMPSASTRNVAECGLGTDPIIYEKTYQDLSWWAIFPF